MSSPTTPVKSTPPSIVTNNARVPSTSFSSASSLSSTFEPLSSAEILERVPTSVVRVLAAFGPFIHGLNRFVRLATWTGGKGSGSSSVLLLVSFWLVCAFGYEFIRYAPQLLILGWIAYTGVRRQVSFAKPRTHPAKSFEKHDLVSAASINATLAELSELADFFSSLRSNVLIPAVQLVSWDPSPMNTKAVAAFVIFTWPLWLAAFLPLREHGFPTLVLPVSFSSIVRGVTAVNVRAYHLVLRLIGSDRLTLLQDKIAPLFARFDQASDYLAKAPLPAVYLSAKSLVHRVRWHQVSGFNVTLLPPYPIGALTVRSLVCLVGTVALTWCSPWGSLYRQAIWKSATVRRLIRGTGRVLSGQTPFSEAYGKGNLDDEWAHGLYHDDGTVLLPKVNLTPASDAKSTSTASSAAQDKVLRHEDVVYQFSIFENQRWWVGLDWTAALLPQERPSWSDESNNPVSPPSSFSLPPTKIMLTPAPTPTDAKAFTRRTIKWQWLDPEWTIAGVNSSVAVQASSSSVYKGSAKEAAIKSATAVDDKDAIAAAKQGYIGDALNRIRARTSGANSSTGSSTPPSPSLGDVGATATRVTGAAAETWDVDADGWQYGDNAWDKMSRKSGMGRYTRHRKWVRRAVLLEIVEHGVHGPAPSSPNPAASAKPAASSESAKSGFPGLGVTPEADADVREDVASAVDDDIGPGGDPAPPVSPSTAKRSSISDRLAQAAH